MRKTNLTFLTCLAITIAALCAQSAFAQATSIFNFDQSWQYYQAGNQPTNQGTVTWRTNTYNDTSWLTGQGVLAYEDAPGPYPPILTTLNRTTNGILGGITNITYYFRTHFTFPTNPLNAVVFFTNVVDDGLILYLNGVRLYDFRVPQINPPWSQYASAGPPAEGTRELFTVTNSALLRQGDNVLAVELHDGSLGSSDVAFGLALAYRFPIPIVITRHPTNEDAVVGDTVDLSVEVTGDSPRYWWFRNAVLVRGPTNSPILRLSNIQLTNAGTYYVVVSNAVSGAQSSNAVVTVVTDIVPPEFVNATINEGDINRVYAIFTEDVARVVTITNITCINNVCTTNFDRSMSATNIANYSLREVAPPGAEVAITAALPGAGQKTVRLTLATNIDCSKEYMLTVRNLTDNRMNVMSPNPGYAIVGCVYRSNLVAFQSSWKFQFAYEGSGLTNNWYTTNYTPDAGWGENVAPFYGSFECETNCFGIVGASCPDSMGTPVTIGYPTYVFRKEFFVPSNSITVGQLRLAHVIDDGAIFYLNGKELLRYNMTNVPVDLNYLTTCNEPEHLKCATNTYTLDNLLIGTNVFAVELHTCDEFVGADVMFGCQLDMIVTNFPTRIPELLISYVRTPTRRAILKWQPRGWRLQTTTNVGSVTSWVNVAGVSTNATGYTNSNPAIDRQRFYRLCRP